MSNADKGTIVHLQAEREIHIQEINRVQRERDAAKRERDELRERLRVALEHLERFAEIEVGAYLGPDDRLADFDELALDVERFFLQVGRTVPRSANGITKEGDQDAR